MELVGDRRGQSIQIGAVLLFGVLIIAFSSYQAFVVPDQNREVEFNHNQEVQSDMQDLRNAIVSVPGSTSSRAVSVSLATRYPSRLVARNPGPPSGSVRTNGTTDMRYNITVRNAAAAGETGDVWNGTARPYNTGTIAYSPNYNVYSNPPTTYYGHSVAYNQFPTANLTLSEQTMVNGRDITLVALNGSLRRSSGGSTTVDVRPVSRSNDPIIVSNDASTSNVSVSVPTRLPESKWKELLADEIDSNPGDLSNDRYVADVTATDGPGPYYNLTITFERGADYRLRMAKAGVGDGVSSEEAAYLTDVGGDGSVAKGDSADLVLEVRDEYNNPVQGVTVHGGVDPGSDGSLTDSEKVSGSDGRVTFEYTTTQSASTGIQNINFSYRGLGDGFSASEPENVTMDVRVTANGGGGGSVNGFSSTSVSNLEADSSGLNQTVSFSPADQSIGAGETVYINFDDAQQSTVNYENYEIADLPAGVSVEDSNVDTGTGTFTVTLSADNPIATADTVSFTVVGVDTGSQAGPLDVDFVREDTGDSETASFNVGGGGGGKAGDSVVSTGSKTYDGDKGFQFTIENRNSRSVTITNISVSVGDSSVASLFEQNGGEYDPYQHEVWIDSSSGSDGVVEMSGEPYYDEDSTEMPLDTVQELNENAVVNSGNLATVYMYQFYKNNKAKSVAGKDVTVELGFQDGSTGTYEFTSVDST
ncbi:Ig-like domain-containing protein [Haloarcula laminariae]|uniref:Ig-like domain-containing protein n=1 Tax=Haloarcula laminariae TaxID=2961577 RepID=UPI0021C9DC0F|nr:Ig-like domain-containing protein [Halomicroarcula laminariae]